MAAPDFSLLTKRRYAPLFAVQFLGAFNDNLLKFAMLFLASFTLYRHDPARSQMLATIATGLFMLPYFLFSGIAGQAADAIDKARLVRLVKGAEMLFMGVGLLGFSLQSMPLLLGALFLMGCHSTLFGPVKYSILPQHLGPRELVGGTGLIEAGTFLAILGGQLLAGVVLPWQAGLIATGLAVVGFLASLAVPPAPALGDARIELNPYKSTCDVLGAVGDARGAWLCILGISWFFAVGAVLLSDFPPLVSAVLGARQEVATLFLLIFSLAVALGSLAVNRLLGGAVSARAVPAAALALGLGMIDLGFASAGFVVRTPDAGIVAFVASPGSWRILADLALIAFAGGMFIVPLYAILQTATPAGERSRVIAANNIVNSAVAVLLVGVVLVLAGRGLSVPGVIGLLGAATIGVAFACCWLMPEGRVVRLFRQAFQR